MQYRLGLFVFFSLVSVDLYAGWVGSVNSSTFRGDDPASICSAVFNEAKGDGNGPYNCTYSDSLGGPSIDNSGQYPIARCPVKRVYPECDWYPNGYEYTWGVSATYYEGYAISSDDPSNSGECEGNPCDVTTGNKIETVEDYNSRNITFTRHYNTGRADTSHFGMYWGHSFETKFNHYMQSIPTFSKSNSPSANKTSGAFSTEAQACASGWGEIKDFYRGGSLSEYAAVWENDLCLVKDGQGKVLARPSIIRDGARVSKPTSVYTRITTANGTSYIFLPTGSSPGEYYEVNGEPVFLSGGNGSYTFVYPNGQKDQFESSRLVSRTLSDGTVLVIERDNYGRVSRIVDPYDHSISLTYTDNHQIASVEHPDGLIQYTYDAAQNLETVTYEDNSSVTYHYENVDFPYHLTGYTDQNNVLFASWRYDDKGRVIESKHALDTDLVQLEYFPDRTVVTDGMGGERIYHMENRGGKRVVASVSGDRCYDCNQNQAQTRQHDEYGNIISRTDWEGVVTNYAYNEAGLEISRVEAVGTANERTILTTWDPVHRKPARVEQGDRATNYFYTDSGLVSETFIENTLDATTPAQSWKFGYDSNNRLNSIDGPLPGISDLTSYTYDSFGQIKTVSNGKGHTKSFSEYNGFGLPGKIVDENGLATELTYSARGWLTQVLTKIPGEFGLRDAITTYEYDALGQLVKSTSEKGQIRHFEYDAARRLSAIENGYGERIEYELDSLGNKTKTTIKDATAQNVYIQSAVFNEINQLVKLLSPYNEEIRYRYNLNGQLIETLDQSSLAWTKSYDALQRIASETSPDNTQVIYSYDALDRLVTVTDQRNLSTHFSYDVFGNLTSTTSPDTGVTEYRYDAAGNRIYKKDAASKVTNYVYDDLSRLTKTEYPQSPEENVDLVYDQTGECSEGIGRLSSFADQSGYTEYQYDVAGKVRQKVYYIEGQEYALAYDYDSDLNLVTITYPHGSVVEYNRDSQGHVGSISYRANATATPRILISNISYRPFGGIERFHFGNGMLREIQSDLSYRTTGINLTSNDAPIRAEYQYDSKSNILSINDLVDVQKSQTFGYDNANRLLAAQSDYGIYTFAYDAVGNRTTQTRSLSGNTTIDTYTHDGNSNRLNSVNSDQSESISQRNLTYSAAGNLIEDASVATLSLGYNEAGRLDGITKNGIETTTYLYNGIGQRVAKVSSDPAQDEHYHYDERGRLLAISNNASQQINLYVYLEDEQVAIVKESVETYRSATCKGDSDSDGLKDWWEWLYFDSLEQTANGDFDGDANTNADEQAAQTNPTKYGPKLTINGESNEDGYTPVLNSYHSQYIEAQIVLTDLDPDDSHTYQLLNAPEWLNFDSDIGLMWGYPMGSSTGTIEGIELKVEDSFAQIGTVQFNLNVLPASDYLAMTSIIRSPRDVSNSLFGKKIEFASDINGDGHVDLLVSAPKTARGASLSKEGELYIYPGDGEKIDSSFMQRFSGNAKGARLGHGFSTIDLNNDGLSELFNCAFMYDFDSMSRPSGTCWYHGNTGTALDPSRYHTYLGWETNGVGSRMGVYTATTDFNGDGLSDVLVTEYALDGNGADSGALKLFYGTNGLPSRERAAYVYGLAAGDQLGLSVGSGSVVAGDFNGDGVGDFAVGDPLHDGALSNSGFARIIYGSNHGLPWNAEIDFDESIEGELQADAQFGSAVGAGDLNGDGIDDLIVSALYRDESIPEQGAVYVYYGSSNGFASIHDVKLTSPGPYNRFGYSLAVADITGDGFGDLMIGQPSYGSSSAGAVFIYSGSATGLSSSPIETLSPNKPSSGFGAYIGIGDYDQDGAFDLAVSDHDYEDGIMTIDGGAVFIYKGKHVSVPPQIEVLQAGVQIIDDLDVMATAQENWTPHTQSGTYGTGFHWSYPGSGDEFIWGFSNKAGRYKIYAHSNAHSNRTSNASFTIDKDGQAEVVSMNQKTASGFSLLGEFTLSERARISLTNIGADGVLIADAIKLEPVSDTPPLISSYESDNSDENSSVIGTWSTYGLGSGFIGDDFLYTDGGGGESVVSWHMGNEAGRFNVYANWLSKDNRASNAPYTIQTNNGDQVVLVDQRYNGASYQLIGTFDMPQNSVITLTNNANGKVIADAIKLELVGQ